MACCIACKLRSVFPCLEYEVDVSLLPEGSGALPVCLAVERGPLGAGSLFSSVAPALRHAAFEQGAVRYSAAPVTLSSEIRARA